MRRESWVYSRGENDGLTDHLTLRISWDSDGIASRAWCTSNKSVGISSGPAAMADVTRGDLRVIGVGGRTGEHTETLYFVRNIQICFYM